MSAEKEEEAEAKITSEKKADATNVEAEVTSRETATEEGGPDREAAAAEDPTEEEDPDHLQDQAKTRMTREGDTTEVTEKDIQGEEEDQKAVVSAAEAIAAEAQVIKRALEVNPRARIYQKEVYLIRKRDLTKRMRSTIQKAEVTIN
jgi:hypothetical protein